MGKLLLLSSDLESILIHQIKRHKCNRFMKYYPKFNKKDNSFSHGSLFGEIENDTWKQKYDINLCYIILLIFFFTN